MLGKTVTKCDSMRTNLSCQYLYGWQGLLLQCPGRLQHHVLTCKVQQV
jgi:hypothetical protein